MNGEYSPNEMKKLDNIRAALSGEEVTDTPVPTSDDEKHLDDILKAAQGEEPLYNLPANWNHQKRLIAIKEAIQEGGGSVPEYEGSYTVTPSESTQTLATDGKKCTDDITVNPISSTYIGSDVTQKAAATYTPTTSDQTIAANQYLSGAQTVKGDANLVAGNIKKDVQLFGVTGTYEGSGGGEPQKPTMTGKNAVMLIDVPYDGFGVTLTVWITRNGVTGTVDWGDNTQDALVAGQNVLTHTYNKGIYWINVSAPNAPNTNQLYLGGYSTTATANALKGYGDTTDYEAASAIKKLDNGKFGIGPSSLCGSGDCFGLTEAIIDGYIVGQAMYGNLLLKKLTIGASTTYQQTSTMFPQYMFGDLKSLSEMTFLLDSPPDIPNQKYPFSNLRNACKIYVPFNSLAAYLTATNYPSPSTYTYIGFATYESGVTLPTQDATEAYNVVWYATKADAIAQTNQITAGNGSEIYCRYTAV